MFLFSAYFLAARILFYLAFSSPKAVYLDEKCAEIDALIAAKEKTNALLKERRQSMIYEAVTKGLDPTAPMKDSGVEWIGEIPEGWTLWHMKHLATEPLQYGANATGSAYDPELPRYVRITDITSERKLNDEGKQSLPIEIAQEYICHAIIGENHNFGYRYSGGRGKHGLSSGKYSRSR